MAGKGSSRWAKPSLECAGARQDLLFGHLLFAIVWVLLCQCFVLASVSNLACRGYGYNIYRALQRYACTAMFSQDGALEKVINDSNNVVWEYRLAATAATTSWVPWCRLVSHNHSHDMALTERCGVEGYDSGVSSYSNWGHPGVSTYCTYIGPIVFK